MLGYYFLYFLLQYLECLGKMGKKEDLRRARFDIIIQSVKKCNEKGKGADKEKLLACFMVEYGLARRTCVEYLQALILSGKVKIKEDGLWTN